MAKDKIWFVYNHNPGGQVVVSHVETRKRRRNLGGEKYEEIIITAEQDLEGIIKSSFITLKLKDKPLQKNKVLVFPSSEELPKDPAGKVLEWAYAQGIEAYEPEKQTTDRQASMEKMKLMEGEILSLQKKIDSLTEALEKKSQKELTPHG